jgi:hypothetical protein
MLRHIVLRSSVGRDPYKILENTIPNFCGGGGGLH